MSTVAARAPTTDLPAGRASTRRIAIVTAVYLAIVLFAVLTPLIFTRNPWSHPSPELQAYRLVLWLVWLPVLIETMRRQPDGPMWMLIFAFVVAEQLPYFAYLPSSIAFSVAQVINTLYVPILVHLMLAFPTGHLQGRWDRSIVAFYYIVIVVFSVLNALTYYLPGDPRCGVDCYRNLFLVWRNDELNGWLYVVSLVIPLATIPLIFARLWSHWRDARWVGRRALAPVLIAMPVLVIAIALEFIGDRFAIGPLIDFYLSPLAPLPLFVLPLVLLAGILRLRLSKGRTAELLVELGRGVPLGGLRDILARTLGDPSLQLAFASPSGQGFVDAEGHAVALPEADDTRAITHLEREGELLGVLIHDPALDDDDPGLVAAVGSAASMALDNERLAAQVRAQLEEVRASRARIVEAGDAERRRVERDLHDGAQQRLVALAMRLQTAKGTSLGASALIDEATAELQTAISEVRDLARGLHPPILTEAGLGAAIEALAERAPLAVATNVPEGRYAPAIEATAYYVIAEALTNVARHADANEAVVSVLEDGGRLVVTISDDGLGGADPAAGSGVRGLADRLAAVGGTLAMDSPAGLGTTVRAELPLR